MKAAVLGKPVTHSLSPVLHTAAYAELGLDDWSYQAIECDEAALPGLIAGFGGEWAGLSLTMPLKRAVLPLLDRADELVQVTGAANTVVFRAGERVGYNTDVPGIVTALKEAGVAVGGEVTILGAGATACSALAAVSQLGAVSAQVQVRDPGRAGALLAAGQRLGVEVRVAALGDPGPGLLISTLPAGAADIFAERARGSRRTPAAVLDVVYDPWPTPLAAAAARTGAIVISGFEMLLHQAAVQVELMTGHPAPVSAMRAAGEAVLTRRSGPPGFSQRRTGVRGR
jgi:shikimate dehydrogenase